MNNKNKYLESLNQIFSDSSPSKDDMLGLMDATMDFFRDIKGKLESKDPSEQKAAFQETIEMKKILEEKMKVLTEKTGLDINQLAALAENSRMMNREEVNAMETAKKNLNLIKNEYK